MKGLCSIGELSFSLVQTMEPEGVFGY